MPVLLSFSYSIISIHALLAESDRTGAPQLVVVSTFLSTLSLRRATRGACRARPQSRPHFYPRSPCGERPCRKRRQWFHHGNFYPRSPCGERRCLPRRPRQRCSNFYPRSPCGERLPEARELSSIKYFYPRSPCGERPDNAEILPLN